MSQHESDYLISTQRVRDEKTKQLRKISNKLVHTLSNETFPDALATLLMTYNMVATQFLAVHATEDNADSFKKAIREQQREFFMVTQNVFEAHDEWANEEEYGDIEQYMDTMIEAYIRPPH